jgi:hypothetical protein
MKTVLFSIAILFVSASLFAHTLVLKNGKKIEGTLVNENSEGLEIRDSQGIVIFVKRSQLDAEATSKLNVKVETVKPAEVEKTKPVEKKAESKSSKKKKEPTRVLRNEDLDKMPEVSIIGTEETAEENEEGEKEKPQSEFSKATSEKSEEYWKDETRRFAQAIHRAEDDVKIFSEECDQLGSQAAYAIYDPQQWIMINGVWVPIDGSYPAETIQQAQQACSDAERAKKELERLRLELEDFQDYARRQGALPGWVDPDRL